ncbi:sigma-54-dependent Fis family transcriptional regulator [Thioclava sp. GXIMD4216]|uniref:sigma-54-dependent Fis family transcriptional regulator n=1 Tax=Thioclava sp. GXIMD4216 TaxID=3131929 RepID=UPI0030D5B66A
MHRVSEHIREIEAVSNGGAVGRDPAVAASWRRCLQEHKLDPARRSEAYIVPSRILRQHRERSGDLISIARSGIEQLYKLVAEQDYVLLLADAAGVTVEFLGQDQRKADLQHSGLYLGAEWSEARAGTCALGACIEGGEPIIVHQSDHFDSTHSGLSCTAAPIHDLSGRLSAVLDISLLSSPRPRASQYLALNLVKQTARRIEMANIMAESRRDWVLRLGPSAEFLDTDPEAAIRLDASGRVTGMTHGAARVMAAALGCDWRRPDLLLGRPISDSFNLDLNGIEALTRHSPARERNVETRNGYRLFAHAIEPRREPVRRVTAYRGTSLPAVPQGLRDLAQNDPAMARVITQAAGLVNGQGAVLLTGPMGSGKRHLARAIHEAGIGGPFVTLRCGEFLAEEEATIFGRETRGLTEPGMIDEAQGGALFLDKLEELPPRAQARLLALISEGAWRPIGAVRAQKANMRIFASLGMPAQQAVAEGRLRRDLYFALRGTVLDLPALRDRQDLVWLAETALSEAFTQPVTLGAEAASWITQQEWAGNLLELRDFARHSADRLVENGALPRQGLQLADLARDYVQDAASKEHGHAALLNHILQQTGGNISETARRLGVNRSTIHRQMQRYGIKRR